VKNGRGSLKTRDDVPGKNNPIRQRRMKLEDLTINSSRRRRDRITFAPDEIRGQEVISLSPVLIGDRIISAPDEIRGQEVISLSPVPLWGQNYISPG